MPLTKYTTRALIAVPAAQRDAANDACATVVPGGRGTFTVSWPFPTDPEVIPTPEYYVCNWQMLPEQRTKLAEAFTAAGVNATFYDCDSWDPALSTVTSKTVDDDLKAKTASLSLASGFSLRAPLTSLRVLRQRTSQWAARWRSWWSRCWVWLVKAIQRVLSRFHRWV